MCLETVFWGDSCGEVCKCVWGQFFGESCGELCKCVWRQRFGQSYADRFWREFWGDYPKIGVSSAANSVEFARPNHFPDSTPSDWSIRLEIMIFVSVNVCGSSMKQREEAAKEKKNTSWRNIIYIASFAVVVLYLLIWMLWTQASTSSVKAISDTLIKETHTRIHSTVRDFLSYSQVRNCDESCSDGLSSCVLNLSG